MIALGIFLLIIPISFILIKLILYFIVKKYGKFSYDGISAAGFAYDSQKDIFYSTINAWQKNFGYTHMYDVLAPIFRMIIDTEPVKFYYNGKNWLISFWKGQYGIVTGAEIGVYYTKQEKINKKTVYLHVCDDELIDMDLVLYKNGKLIARLCAKHWWLAIFKLGLFSWPKELSVDVNIVFHNREMLMAFLSSFKKLGYKDNDYKIIDNTFCFKYIKPRTRKVWTRTWLIDHIGQYFNRRNVELYNGYLGDFIDDDRIDNSIIDNDKKLIMLNDLIPNLLKNKDDTYSKQVSKKLSSNNKKNILFLDNDLSFKNEENDDE